jgi:hypothetical protein
MKQNPYVDPEYIEALYEDPQNEVLLAEYLLQTGGSSSNTAAGTTAGTPAGLDSTVIVQELRGTGSTAGGPTRCFTGETLVRLINDAQISFFDLYRLRAKYIGQKVKSFDAENRLVGGEILDIFKSQVKEILEVHFWNEPNPMRMVKTHRFWTEERRFAPMYLLTEGERVFAHEREWTLIPVQSMQIVPYPEGIDVFNMTIGVYHDYFAHAALGLPKAVSNIKRIELEEQTF